MNNKITCPVCGYDGFDHLPQQYDICPSCLLEFGVSDVDWTHDELRQDWIEHGAKWAWGSQDIPRPANWSACRQLLNLGYRVTPSDLLFMGITDLNADELARAQNRLTSAGKVCVGERRDGYQIQPSDVTVGSVFVISSGHVNARLSKPDAQSCALG